MKLRTILLFAVILAVFSAVPAMAAPTVKVEAGCVYGTIVGAHDYIGTIIYIPAFEKETLRLNHPGIAIPSLSISVGVTPDLNLTLSGWYADSSAASSTTVDQGLAIFPWIGSYLIVELLGEDLQVDAASEVRWINGEIGIDYDLVKTEKTHVSLLTGARVMKLDENVSVYLTAPPVPAAVYDEYWEASLDGWLVGPYAGISAETTIAPGLWLYGRVAASALWGTFDTATSISGTETVTGIYPALDGALGMTYNVTDWLFVRAGVNATVVFGVPTMGRSIFGGEDTRDLIMAGVGGTIGFRF